MLLFLVLFLCGVVVAGGGVVVAGGGVVLRSAAGGGVVLRSDPGGVVVAGGGLRSVGGMARSLREYLLDALARLGVHLSLGILLLPIGGHAWNDVTTEILRVIRWIAGYVRDRLVANEVAGPHLISEAVNHLLEGRAVPQHDGDLTADEDGRAVRTDRKAPRCLAPRKRRKRAAARPPTCREEARRGEGGGDTTSDDEDRDNGNNGDRKKRRRKGRY